MKYIKWLKQHPIKGGFIAFFALSFLAVVAFIALFIYASVSLFDNYACLESAHGKTPDEKIRMVLRAVNSHAPVPRSFIPYTSVDELLSKNPNCCMLVRSKMAPYYISHFDEAVPLTEEEIRKTGDEGTVLVHIMRQKRSGNTFILQPFSVYSDMNDCN